jgi:hypothetical protein
MGIKLEGAKKTSKMQGKRNKIHLKPIVAILQIQKPKCCNISSFSSIRVFPISMNLSMDGEPSTQSSLGQFL